MNYLTFILSAFLTLLPTQAAVLSNGILAASDTSGTNATVRGVTITASTNLTTGGLVVNGPQTNVTLVYLQSSTRNLTTNFSGTSWGVNWNGPSEGYGAMSGDTTISLLNSPATTDTTIFNLTLVGDGSNLILPAGTITPDNLLTNVAPAASIYTLQIVSQGGTNYVYWPWYLQNQITTNYNNIVLNSSNISANAQSVVDIQSFLTNSYTQTGTHASPSTTDPLSPTWSGYTHTVWYGVTGTINLPAVSTYTGKAILIYNTGAFTITVDPDGSEVIVRDGTVQTGGVSMTLSSGAGNYVAILCDGSRWITLGYKGTLAQGS